MDYLMPDDRTMEIMRKEFAKLATRGGAKTFSLSATEGGTRPFATGVAALLFLYFVKNMRYNRGYGTEIFNSYGSMGKLYPVGSSFRAINNLR